MFAINNSPVFNLNNLVHTLDSLQQYQQYQQMLQQQQQDTRPKITKKVEAEDKYQIQIFKKSGNFNSYEVRVLRTGYPLHKTLGLVNLVIESVEDDFKKVFQFNLDDIDVNNIGWEYFKDDNVLVLNVPKKVKYCSDDFANSLLSSLFGVPEARVPEAVCHVDNKVLKKSKKAERKEARELRRAEDAELAAARKAARAKVAEHRAQEQAREEAREQARREEQAREQARREEQAREQVRREEARREEIRKEEARREEARVAEIRRYEARIAEAKAQRIQEEKTRRLAAVRARKEAEAASQNYKGQQQDNLAKQQEFLRQLFGGNFIPYGQFQEPRPQEQDASHDESMSETESISSEAETPEVTPSLSPVSEKLHRQPSLEEVEDEEFVMFRKKFGEK